MFADTVASCQDRPAIDAPDATLSYAELSTAALEVAARLRERGIGPGDRVGIHVASGTSRLYVAILGVLHAGAAYVPVDADDPPARASAVWESAGACAVIGDRDERLSITELAAPLRSDRPVTPDDDAWVIFTSGSTGQPKGVAVSHRSAAAFVDAEARLWTVDAEDRVLAGLSVGFDASCEEIWLAWRHGAALVPAPSAIVRAAPSSAHGSSASRHRRLDCPHPGGDVGRLRPRRRPSADPRRRSLSGGARMRLGRDREVWNTYGPTEATVVSTAARLTPERPVTIGWPLSGWQIAVLDGDGETVPLGEPGELVIAGVGLGRYLDPALDAERFARSPGARLGARLPDRRHRRARRSTGSSSSAGATTRSSRRSPRRARRARRPPLSLAGVKAAAAAVRKTAAGHALLVGYVVGDVDPAAARAQLAERLPDGVVPLVVPLDTLPRGSSGRSIGPRCRGRRRRCAPRPPVRERTARRTSVN